jgi:molybdopterin-guanine dinucleotide biosynthesis protein A
MTRRIDRAGFVVVGGASRRMAQDKALLPLGGVNMVEEIAAKVRAACVVPEIAGRIDPLGAVYHRRLVSAAESATDRKLFKMQYFVSTLRTFYWRLTDARPLLNVNTPAEWSK